MSFINWKRGPCGICFIWETNWHNFVELIGMNLKIVKKILVTTSYWPKLLTTFYQVPTCYHFIWPASDTEWKYSQKRMIFSKMNYTQRGGSINSGNIKNICIMKQRVWLDFSYLEAISGVNSTTNCYESILH